MKMEYKEKRIIITGGNGFIGSHLSNKLTTEKNVDEVHIIDLFDSSEVNPILLKRNNLYFHNVDILDLNSLCEIIKQINPTHVFHLAAILNRSRDFSALETSISVNVLGTCNLLHALRDIPLSRFLHMNTSECYGHNSTPFTENMSLSPCSPYSASKSSSELFTRVFSEMYSIPTTYIRSFNVFGEGQSEDMLIPQVIISGLEKKDIDLTKGEQTRDSIYIKDIIEGICLATFSEKSVGIVINLCSQKDYSIQYLAEKIVEIGYFDIKLNFGKLQYRKSEIMEMVGDSTKARQLLGWKPHFTLNEGLSKTIDWYRNNYNSKS